MLSDLVTMSRVRRGHSAESRQRVPRRARAVDRNRAGRAATTSRHPADFEGLDFTPVRADDFDAPEPGMASARSRIVVPAEARDAEKGKRAALHPARAAQAGRARSRRRDRCAAASGGARARSPLYRLDRHDPDHVDARAGRGGFRVRDRRLRDRDRRSAILHPLSAQSPKAMPWPSMPGGDMPAVAAPPLVDRKQPVHAGPSAGAATARHGREPRTPARRGPRHAKAASTTTRIELDESIAS